MLAVVPLDLVVAPKPASLVFSEDVIARLAVFVLVALFVSALATARRRAELERLVVLDREREARKEAESANRTKDQFVAMVAHELRSPLAAILSWADALADDRLSRGGQTRAVAAIRRNAAFQARVIADLVDLAKVARGNISLDLASIDLREVIEAAVETNTATARERGVKVAVDVLPGCRPIAGDAMRLQQVVSNLLTNAIKHSEDGAAISVTLDTVDRYARIQVEDEGTGIDPDLLPHVFEPYRQGAAEMTRSGLGLGLAIVRQLVELHGGHVKAASAGVGRGACFAVFLPVTELCPGTTARER
jgi:signal transduction histidine kinase